MSGQPSLNSPVAQTENMIVFGSKPPSRGTPVPGSRPSSRDITRQPLTVPSDITDMPKYLKPISKGEAGDWKQLHDSHMVNKLTERRKAKNQINRRTKDEARNIIQKVPIDLLAKEWLKDTSASVDTRAYLVNNVMPTLILGCEKLLVECDKKDCIDLDGNVKELKINPLNFLAQYLMRNNPRYSNFSEASPYIRGLRDVANELKGKMFNIEENRLARVKAAAKEKREARELEEYMQEKEKERRKKVLRKQYDEWNISDETTRVELALLQNALRSFVDVLERFPEELRLITSFNPALENDTSGKVLNAKQFVEYMTDFIGDIPREIFEAFIDHMSQCALNYKLNEQRKDRMVILKGLFAAIDSTGVGILDRHRVLHLFEMYYDKLDENVKILMKNPRKWPVRDLREIDTDNLSSLAGDDEEFGSIHMGEVGNDPSDMESTSEHNLDSVDLPTQESSRHADDEENDGTKLEDNDKTIQTETERNRQKNITDTEGKGQQDNADTGGKGQQDNADTGGKGQQDNADTEGKGQQDNADTEGKGQQDNADTEGKGQQDMDDSQKEIVAEDENLEVEQTEADEIESKSQEDEEEGEQEEDEDDEIQIRKRPLFIMYPELVELLHEVQAEEVSPELKQALPDEYPSKPPATQQSHVSFAEGTNFERERSYGTNMKLSKLYSTLFMSEFVNRIENEATDSGEMSAINACKLPDDYPNKYTGVDRFQHFIKRFPSSIDAEIMKYQLRSFLSGTKISAKRQDFTKAVEDVIIQQWTEAHSSVMECYLPDIPSHYCQPDDQNSKVPLLWTDHQYNNLVFIASILAIEPGIIFYWCKCGTPYKEPPIKLLLSRSQSAASAFDENNLNESQFIRLTETFIGDTPLTEDFQNLIRFINNGYIETEEERVARLIQARQEALALKRKSLLNTLFEMWDNDGSGFLDVDEVEAVMSKYKEGVEQAALVAENEAPFENAVGVGNAYPSQAHFDSHIESHMAGNNSDYSWTASLTSTISQTHGKKEMRKKNKNFDNRLSKREFRDFFNKVIENMSELETDPFDGLTEFCLNSLERSYTERIRGGARKKWLNQIKTSADMSGVSLEPVYKAVFQAINKDAETHGNNKVISAYVAMLEKNTLRPGDGDFLLRYVASTPDSAPYLLGNCLFKSSKGISFQSVETGKPIHVPKVSNHGNIHFWNTDRSPEDIDGAFLVVPLKDRRKRVFGLLGLDTLNDPRSRAIFITHEIQYYQGVAKNFSIAYHSVDIRQKSIRIAQSAMSWIHRRSSKVVQVEVYIKEPEMKNDDYVLVKMLITDPNDDNGRPVVVQKPSKLARRDNLFRDYLFKCVDNSDTVTADAYGHRHLAVPLRDEDGLAVIVVDISIGQAQNLPKVEEREVMKVLKLLQMAYQEIVREANETSGSDEAKEPTESADTLFDRLMLKELQENVGKLDPTAYAEIKSYVVPPPIIHKIMRSVLSIFYPSAAKEGQFDVWSNCKQLLTDYVTPSLNQNVISFDPTSEDVNAEEIPLEDIQQHLDDIPQGQVAKHGSQPAEYLYNWVFVCVSLLDHSRRMMHSKRMEEEQKKQEQDRSEKGEGSSLSGTKSKSPLVKSPVSREYYTPEERSSSRRAKSCLGREAITPCDFGPSPTADPKCSVCNQLRYDSGILDAASPVMHIHMQASKDVDGTDIEQSDLCLPVTDPSNPVLQVRTPEEDTLGGHLHPEASLSKVVSAVDATVAIRDGSNTSFVNPSGVEIKTLFQVESLIDEGENLPLDEEPPPANENQDVPQEVASDTQVNDIPPGENS